MAGASFSLAEKLAVTGAFLALVAMVVGTEDDPGLVVTGQKTVRELRIETPEPQPAAQASAPQPVSRPASEALSPPESLLAPPQTSQSQALSPRPQTSDDDHRHFDPELGRAPLDFSNGPPGS